MGARAVSEKCSILGPRSSVSVDGDDDVDDGGTSARVVCIHDDDDERDDDDDDDDDEHDDEHDDAVGSVRDARFSRESVEKSR
jgi:hypothetical protein